MVPVSDVTTRRARPLRDAALAVSLLTLVPAGVRTGRDERSSASGWFPAVGLALGGLVWALVAFVAPATAVETHPHLVAVLVVTAHAVLTRLLHWDGLADVADAWWGGHTVERRLEIMKDSATGAFGVSTLVIVALLQVTAIADLIAAGGLLPLLFAPLFGRTAATFAAWFGQPARDGGLGRSVIGRPSVASLLPAVVAIGCVVLLLNAAMGLPGAVVSGVGLLLALVVPHLISLRMGGVTGDVMGASVLIVETAVYVICAFGAEVLFR